MLAFDLTFKAFDPLSHLSKSGAITSQASTDIWWRRQNLYCWTSDNKKLFTVLSPHMCIKNHENNL